MKHRGLVVWTVPLLLAGCATQKSDSAACPADSAGCGGVCQIPAGMASVADGATGEALRAALADERRARSLYEAVIARHGRVMPFANIVHAEERHEAAVAAVMQRHSVPVPEAAGVGAPDVPATVRECAALAAQAERDNIAMYDRLLASVKEPDVRALFERLRSVSLNNHLPAFERIAG